MKDYSELKMLAEKATPGPWHIDSHGMTMTSMESFKTVFNHPTDRPSVRHEETGNLSNWRNDWDASYIATANPKVILEILEELESLKKDAARYHWTNIEGNWVARMFGKWRAHVGEYGDSNPTEWFDTREEAIDAAMSKKE